MTWHQYHVLKHGVRWRVRYDGRDFDYGTRAEATRAALVAAQKIGRQGLDAQVLVQGDDGTWRTEWASGTNPPLPKA